MATSKGRSSGGSKSALAKKSSGESRGSAPSKVAASRGGKATTSNKSTASSSKGASSSSRSGGGSSASSAARGSASRSAGTGTKATVSNATGRGGTTAKKTAVKSSAPRGGAASKSTAATRSSATASRKGAQQRTDGRPLSANDLEKAFKDLLKDIYYAEKKLKTALGKMSKSAQHADLKEAFTVHQGQTDEQISKLEDVFEMLGMKAVGKKCAAMDGLLEEGDEHMEEYEKGPGRDAALIVGAQKVEHYEMAAYGSLRNFANVIGEAEAAGVFEEILQQETDTDELLTSLSDTINRMAYGAHNDQGSDSDDSRSGGGRGNNNSESKSGSSGSSRSSSANASRQADKDMESDDEGDSSNRGSSSGKSSSSRDDGGGMDASAGSDDTGRGRTGSSADTDDADTGSNR